MWQNKFIEISMSQSNADGGLFRCLGNVKEMFWIMFLSWFLFAYFILFVIIITFLIFLSRKRYQWFRYPKTRFTISLILVFLCAFCSGVVFYQISEIREDISKIQNSSDYFTNQIIYQISLSANNTKISFIKALKNKKFELFPLVDKALTDIVKIANRSLSNDNSTNFSFDLFGKSDTIIDIIKRANLYVNSTYDMRNTLFKLPKICNINFFQTRLLCVIYKNDCHLFFNELKTMENFFKKRDLINKPFTIFFGKIVPIIKKASKAFNVSNYLMTPVQFYDDGVSRMDEMFDKMIHEELTNALSKAVYKNQPLITNYLQKAQTYLYLFLSSLVAVNVTFLLLVIIIIGLKYLEPNKKQLILSTVIQILRIIMYIFSIFMLIIFVVGTSVLINSQTEVCRYLADISQSSDIADRFIDSFLDNQSRDILAKNIPEKILSIPKLNIKNPKGILTTVIRQCPAKRILLPSLKLYRPINTTAIIFSDFLQNDVLNPNLIKANESLYENIENILKISNQIFDAKDYLLEVLKYFPQSREKTYFIFGKLNKTIDGLNFRRNKVFEDTINRMLTFENGKFDECFDFISNANVFKENESLLFDLMDDMQYFENLIKELIVILDNIKEIIYKDGGKYFTTFLYAIVEPMKIIANRLISILEKDTLSRVIPCKELSNFYMETVNVLCTNQLGNFLVLMMFETWTFTIGLLLMLVIKMCY